VHGTGREVVDRLQIQMKLKRLPDVGKEGRVNTLLSGIRNAGRGIESGSRGGIVIHSSYEQGVQKKSQTGKEQKKFSTKGETIRREGGGLVKEQPGGIGSEALVPQVGTADDHQVV